jgi:hypothetical protein
MRQVLRGQQSSLAYSLHLVVCSLGEMAILRSSALEDMVADTN